VNQTLVLIVNEPAVDYGIRKSAWRGSLECKAGDWTADQIIAHAGKAEYIERVWRVGGLGVEDITDSILTWAEENA
jgi:hypothetical protein